jgi:uncharacterized protein
MTDEILAIVIRQFLAQDVDSLAFIWQGGEPTLMGLPFFKLAVEYEMKFGRGQSVSNAIQTNGILLDKVWVDFLIRYKFLVGLSIDGTEHIHNKYRKSLSGKGTWNKVNDRAKMLMDRGVQVNSLSVVTDYSVNYPQEIYEYLKETGFTYMQFIPCCERNPKSPSGMATWSVPAYQYGKFLCTIFDLWIADFIDGKPSTSIRFFDSLAFAYAGLRPMDCTLLEQCGTYLVVEHTGDIYSCDFYVTPEWKLGNVKEIDLIALWNSNRQLEFGLRKVSLPSICLKCEWLKFCRGGCPKDWTNVNSETTISYFCESFKIFFAHAASHSEQRVV